MHRPNSLNRFLDEYSLHLPVTSASLSPASSVRRSYSSASVDLLPRYVEECRKKQTRFRAEHAVHLIPLVLIFCVLVLWLAGSASQGTVSLDPAGILLDNQRGISLRRWE